MKSKKLKIAVWIIGGFLIALVIFAFGLTAGFHKAKFSCDWGKNYERNFMMPHPGMMDGPRGPMGMMGEKFRDFEGRDLRNAYGIAGTIISIASDKLIVKDKDEKENTISVSNETIIKSGRDDIKIADLKNDDEVVIMGKPGDGGMVNADLIRVFAEEK